MVIHSVGILNFRNASTGQKLGCIDVCVDDDGNVHMRVNRLGEEVVLKLSKAHAMTLAEILDEATAERAP